MMELFSPTGLEITWNVEGGLTMNIANYAVTLVVSSNPSRQVTKGYFTLASCSNPSQLWAFPAGAESSSPLDVLEVDFDDGNNVPLDPGPSLIKGQGNNVILRWDWGKTLEGTAKFAFNPFNISGIPDNFPIKVVLDTDTDTLQFFILAQSPRKTTWGLDISFSSDVAESSVYLDLDGQHGTKGLPFGDSSWREDANSIGLAVGTRGTVTIQLNLMDLKAGQ
jgi:hypothetical protein